MVEESAASRQSIGPALPALGHAVSGAAGSALSTLIIYPLNLVITRLQVQKILRDDSTSDNDDYKGILDALEKIYEQEGGIKAFYSGCGQDVGKSVIDSFLFFLAYSFLRTARQKSRGNSKSLPFSNELVIGMIAGAFSKFFTTPLSNVVTRKQTAAMVAARNKSSSLTPELSTKDIALQIRDEKGLRGLWSGYNASLVLTLNPSLTMLLHEVLLRALIPKNKRNNPGGKLTFLIAAISKGIASTITYPFSLAKTRSQVSARKEEPEVAEKENDVNDRQKSQKTKDRTVFAAVYRIAKTEGILALYQGLSGEVLKGFFAHGLTMLMKERIHKLVIQLYYLVLKALKRYPSPERLLEKGRVKLDDAKRAVQPYADKTKEIIQDATKQGGGVASNTVNATQDVFYKSQEELEELYERNMQHARDILWGIVDDGDDE